jgi:hypothetical protein
MKILKRLFGGRRSKPAPSGRKAIESRLVLEDKELYRLLCGVDDASRRRAGSAAARFAVTHSSLKNQTIETALSVLESDKMPDDAMVSAVEHVVDELDSEYFDLYEKYENEGGDKMQYLVPFRRARAASAVAFALSGAVDQCIYEAIHAAELKEVRDIVMASITR